ncbi:transmembrane protein, putative [Medicago truncatula]|uniref:Transmembrane protein, putative n=1 Tax=Medicago truncatula TaxID=3880 RepID=A0A072UL96_MEDTR|nr:transmembrane protein, putative [Medicago truncatula]
MDLHISSLDHVIFVMGWIFIAQILKTPNNMMFRFQETYESVSLHSREPYQRLTYNGHSNECTQIDGTPMVTKRSPGETKKGNTQKHQNTCTTKITKQKACLHPCAQTKEIINQVNATKEIKTQEISRKTQKLHSKAPNQAPHTKTNQL